MIMSSLTLTIILVIETAFVSPFVITTDRLTTPLYAAIDAANDVMVDEARNSKPLIATSMPPPIPEDLKNKYYFLRHGQSTANVAEVISSARSLSYSD